MRNPMFYLATVVLMLAACSPSFAQQRADSGPSDHAKVEQLADAAPKHYYRLNYVLRETDEGRAVNQRTFVVTINPEVLNAQGEVIVEPKWWSVRAGTRVPYATGAADAGKYSYADIGVNLDSRGYEVGDSLQLEVSS